MEKLYRVGSELDGGPIGCELEACETDAPLDMATGWKILRWLWAIGCGAIILHCGFGL